MKKTLLTVVRWVGLSVASIAMLAVLGGGLVALLKFTGAQGDVKAPKVEFYDFKTFKNFVPDLEDDTKNALLRQTERDAFYKDFDTNYAIILKNITHYAKSVNQSAVDPQSLEKYLFDSLSRYDYKLKTSYIEQLAVQTKKLVAYGEEIQGGSTAKTIEWVDFLNWFEKDFEAQLLAELDKRETDRTEVVSIEASVFTLAVSIGAIFLVSMLFIMMLLLLKIETNTRKEELSDEESTKTKKSSPPKKS
jgi:hypothetical protein